MHGRECFFLRSVPSCTWRVKGDLIGKLLMGIIRVAILCFRVSNLHTKSP